MKKVISPYGSVEALDAIEAAKSLGFFVTISSSDPCAEVAYLADKIVPGGRKSFFQSLEEMDFILPLPLGKQYSLIAEANSKFGFPGIKEHHVNVFLDKWETYNTLKKFGINVPAFSKIFGMSEYFHDKPAIIKPRCGVGSRGVRYFQKGSDLLHENISEHPDYGEFIVTEYLDGPEVIFEGYVDKGKFHFIGATIDTIAAAPSVFKTRVEPFTPSIEQMSEIESKFSTLATALECDKIILHVQTKLCGGKNYVIEIEGRPGILAPKIFKHSYGISYYNELLNFICNKPFSFQHKENNYAIWGTYPFKPGLVNGVDISQSQKFSVENRLLFPLGKDLSNPQTTDDRWSTFLVKGKSKVDADELYDKFIQNVKVEYGFL